MTLLELVKHLRLYILDDSGGFGVDWSDISEDDNSAQQLRWTNEELTSYINEAIRQVYRRLKPVEDATTYSITVVADTAEYSLNSNIIEIINAKLSSNGEILERKDIKDLFGDTQFYSRTGTPTYYIPNHETGEVRLYPIPEANDTIRLHVYRYPTSTLAWSTNSSSPELRTEYHIPMLYHAAHLAYLKDEANTFDPNRSAIFKKMFDDEFSDTSAYGETRRRRTSNRATGYGGIGFRYSL